MSIQQQQLRNVAEQMVEEYDWEAVGDDDRIREWLADRGLLSPKDAPDRRADRAAVDDVRSHAIWLLS